MTSDSQQAQPQRATGLVVLGSVSALGYAILLWLSWDFGGDTPNAEKPTIWMLRIFGGLFALYWAALWLAVRLPPTRVLVGGTFAAACLFRTVLLPSIPMHEIDIYRYIWDGAVLAEGVSPYRFPPDQVRNAVEAGGVDDDLQLQRLVELQAQSGGLSDSLFTIHYGEYPSPYPVVSQAVFAVSDLITPDSASKHYRMVTMKTLLVAFDLATLVVVILLLREIGLHVGWSVAYGWCPLVMKEVANGGHLDSIAIFLTTLAIWLLVRAAKATDGASRRVVVSGLVLALAIGAKLYPVVLVPLFASVWLRQLGWKFAAIGLSAVGLCTAALLYPLTSTHRVEPTVTSTQSALSTDEGGQLNSPGDPTVAALNADAGIKAFLNQWEMNDLIFMVVLENLRQQEAVAPEQRPWFVVTSDGWSEQLVAKWANLKSRLTGGAANAPLSRSELQRASFSLARVLTGGIFACFACLLAWRVARSSDPHNWCRAAMLTLAWFWLTCPTQNPWYWCWVVPLLPFARYRTWHLVAAMTMLYYLRFWLTAHFPQPPVLGTPYNGTYFFYFVVAWLEFLPILVALSIEWCYWKKNGTA